MSYMKELIQNELKHDPLYRYLEQEGILFEFLDDDEFFNKLSESHSYSTGEVTKIIGEQHKPWEVRNYLNRYQIDEYVKVQTIGNRKVVDYLGVAKLKMIFLAKQLLNRGPMTIAEIIGHVASSSLHGSNYSVKEDYQKEQSGQDELYKMFQQMIFLTNLKQQKDNASHRRDLLNNQIKQLSYELERNERLWEKERTHLEEQKTLYSKLDVVYDELKRHQKASVSSMSDFKDALGFKGLFKKTKKEAEVLYNEHLERVKDEDYDFANEEIKRINQSHEQLEEEEKNIRRKIQEEVEKLKEEVNEVTLELQQIEQRILSIEENVDDKTLKNMKLLSGNQKSDPI
ncbi:hypothetical protein ACTWQB_16280 [Piscibacillus sp. B03]|uniref:hypothetical protein n=1 Tax=Piscibacillus sp. B03 TaxID=3457430 RepID=UPI003FCE6435